MVKVGDVLQMFYPGHGDWGLTYFAEVTYVKKDMHPNSKVEFNYLNREGRDRGYIRISKLKRNLENGSITILGDYQFVDRTKFKHKFI